MVRGFKKNSTMDPADHLPAENVERILQDMDLRAMLNMARTGQRYAALLRDDSFWARLMRKNYAQVFDWCRGRLPIFYQANDLLSASVLQNIRGPDLQWQHDFDDADIAMPWKRFYLYTRRSYRHPINSEEQAQEAKRQLYNSFMISFIQLLISGDAVFQNARGRHPLPFSAERSPIQTFFFDDIQLTHDGGVTYDGAVRTDIVLADPNQRAAFVQLLHDEPEPVPLTAERAEEKRMRLMAMYDMYADILSAPVSLFMLFDHRVLRLMRQDNSRLIRVFGLVTLDANNDPVASLAEYAERLVSGFFYDCNDMRDFMLWTSDIYDTFYDFMRRDPYRPVEGLRECAEFTLRLMLDQSTAPRSRREKRRILMSMIKRGAK